MKASSSIRKVLVIGALALAGLPCLADEVAVLKNGFSIRHERRVVVGDVTRLYVTADGASFVDVPTAEIEHYEAAPESKSPFLAKDARNGVPSSLVASARRALPRPSIESHLVQSRPTRLRRSWKR